MSLATRLQLAAKFAAGAFRALAGQWEGGEVNRLRSRPPVSLTSQDVSLDYGNREKLMSEARNLCQTFPIAKLIVRKFAGHVVGSCAAKWNTGDPEIDRIFAENWRQRSKMIDADGRHDIQKLARLVVESQLRDGDVFAQKVEGKLGPAKYGMVRMIEADRVNSGTGSIYSVNTEDMIGGIKLAKNGRIQSVRVCRRTNFGSFTDPIDVPAKEMLHIYDPDRIDAIRGVTDFETALNTMRDWKEILDAQRGAIKVNSKLALIMKTITGGAGMGRDMIDSNDTTKGTTTEKVEEINDVATAYMFPSEDLKAHGHNLPGGDWKEFADHLVMLIAASFNVPSGLIWAMLGTGPSVRFDMAQAKRTFDTKVDMLQSRFLNPVCAYVTSIDMQEGRIPFHPAWYKFVFRRPVSITIDAGRDSAAGIQENKNGLMSASNWFDESSDDFYEETEEIAKEAAFRREMAKKYGVDLAEIRGADTVNAGTVERFNLTVDAYGKAVRAGVFTPCVEDENALRAQIGLPPVGASVKKAWKADDGIRRPITLQNEQQQGGGMGGGNPGMAPKDDPEDDDEEKEDDK